MFVFVTVLQEQASMASRSLDERLPQGQPSFVSSAGPGFDAWSCAMHRERGYLGPLGLGGVDLKDR